MDDKHLEQLAVWIYNNIAPATKDEMPIIFNDENQEKLEKIIFNF